ncbi:MAG: geranylgeranylglycerol-phosphate geranylgeranyltransferase [Bacteroidia bacterium]
MMRFLKLIRFNNLLIMVLTQLSVYQCLNRSFCLNRPISTDFLLLLLTTLFLGAAGYVINDYFDVKIDAVNKPKALLVDRFIKRRWAIVLHVSLNLTAIAIGFYLSEYLGLSYIIVASVLWFYSVSLKRKLIIGNLAIALLMAATLLMVKIYDPSIRLIWVGFFAYFAFFTGWIREIIKDVEDMRGDAMHNCRTLPVVFGIYKSKLAVMVLNAIMGLSLIAATVYSFWQELPLLGWYFILAVLLPFVVFDYYVRKAHRLRHFSHLSTGLKLIILAGVLAMPVLCLS